VGGIPLNSVFGRPSFNTTPICMQGSDTLTKGIAPSVIIRVRPGPSSDLRILKSMSKMRMSILTVRLLSEMYEGKMLAGIYNN